MIAIGLAPLAGCTLLVGFIDQPIEDTCDGSSCDASIDASDASADTNGKDTYVADVRDAGPPDVALLDKGKSNGWYCGFNGLNGTAPSKDDLVECHAGGVFVLTLCEGGCLSSPNGVPDPISATSALR